MAFGLEPDVDDSVVADDVDHGPLDDGSFADLGAGLGDGFKELCKALVTIGL